MRIRFAAAVLVLLAGCSGVELDPNAPRGFDLNGRWFLNSSLSDHPDPRSLRAGIAGEPNRRAQRRSGGKPPGGAMAFVTQDFPVLRANLLDIEQNADSMGVRFDRGGYRDVSWGYRERGRWEVHAGWEEGRLVILSEANDVKARESLTLSQDKRRITVLVEVRADRRDYAATRVFDRAP